MSIINDVAAEPAQIDVEANLFSVAKGRVDPIISKVKIVVIIINVKLEKANLRIGGEDFIVLVSIMKVVLSLTEDNVSEPLKTVSSNKICTKWRRSVNN